MDTRDILGLEVLRQVIVFCDLLEEFIEFRWLIAYPTLALVTAENEEESGNTTLFKACLGTKTREKSCPNHEPSMRQVVGGGQNTAAFPVAR